MHSRLSEEVLNALLTHGDVPSDNNRCERYRQGRYAELRSAVPREDALRQPAGLAHPAVANVGGNVPKD
jgi:hypothetical protein